MRRFQGVLLLAGLTAFVAADRSRPALAQPAGDGMQPTYWAKREGFISLNQERLKKYHTDNNKPLPASLQLYVARNGGNFSPAQKIAFEPKGTQPLGFSFSVEKDGDYEFATQFIYQDGTVNRKPEDLGAERRMIIDTVPPVVQLRGSGNSVDWTVSDENLDPAGVKLQCKFPSWTAWETVNDRAMKATDRFAWKLRPNEVLEVRVLARDKAGNEGVSSIVRLPADGAAVRPVPGGGTGGEWLPQPGAGAGVGGGNAPRPRILYVNTKEFDIDYTIERMGRSGVKTAHLYVLKELSDWAAAGSKPVNLMPVANGKEQKLSMRYTADKEGMYGFVIIPENGAGDKQDPPRKDDQPQILVVVDTKAPVVKITNISVRPGGVRGPLVDIAWEAADPYLMPNTINLEYSIDRDAPVWKEIKYRTANAAGSNAGRFEWEVPDTAVWQFHVRISATDLAGNTGTYIWDKQVIVDLEKPAAGIQGVRGSGTPAAPATTPMTPPKSPDRPAAGGAPTDATTTPPTPALPSGIGPPPPPAAPGGP